MIGLGGLVVIAAVLLILFCQNTAEHVIYMVLGTIVRHIKLDDILAEIEAQSEQEPE